MLNTVYMSNACIGCILSHESATIRLCVVEHVNCHEKLQLLCSMMERLDSEEEILQRATGDIATLCGENVILWSQFTETVSHSKVTFHLAKEHHNMRVSSSSTTHSDYDYAEPSKSTLSHLGQHVYKQIFSQLCSYLLQNGSPLNRHHYVVNYYNIREI